MIHTPSLYRDLAGILPRDSINPIAGGLYVTSDHILVTDTYRALIVTLPNPKLSRTLYIPAGFARKYMAGQVDIVSDTHVQTKHDTIPIQQNYNLEYAHDDHERIYRHITNMIDDKETQLTTALPLYTNAGQLADMLAIIDKHDDNDHNGVRIYTKGGNNDPIIITGKHIRGVLMPYNQK